MATFEIYASFELNGTLYRVDSVLYKYVLHVYVLPPRRNGSAQLHYMMKKSENA